MDESGIIQGYYGSSNTPCSIMFYNGWYCIVGGNNINHTIEPWRLKLGIDIETLADDDVITVTNPVYNLTDLINIINEDTENW